MHRMSGNKNMTPRIALSIVCVLTVLGLAADGLAEDRSPNAPYEPTWESLAKAPVPQWWDNGKFGILIHWGPYSVAGYKDRNRGYAEAITHDLYKRPGRYVEFMTNRFGAAPPNLATRTWCLCSRRESGIRRHGADHGKRRFCSRNSSIAGL